METEINDVLDVIESDLSMDTKLAVSEAEDQLVFTELAFGCTVDVKPVLHTLTQVDN